MPFGFAFPDLIGGSRLLPAGSTVSYGVAGPITGSFGVTLASTGEADANYDLTNVSKASIECWFKTTTTATAIMVGDRGSNKGLQLGVGPTGFGSTAGQPFVIINGASLVVGAHGTATVNDGNWHHLVGVCNGTSGATAATSDFHVYVDGVAPTTGTDSHNSFTYPWSGQGGVHLGQDSLGTSRFLGSLSRVAIWAGVALTSTQVANHFAQTTAAGYDAAVLADSPSVFWTLDAVPRPQMSVLSVPASMTATS